MTSFGQPDAAAENGNDQFQYEDFNDSCNSGLIRTFTISSMYVMVT